MNRIFSIILLTFKRDDYIQETLTNIFEETKTQNNYGYELVLVDNNEDNIDRSSFISQFSHPVYVKLGINKGVTGGRNAGISASSGAYLIFFDDDIMIQSKDFLYLIHNKFKLNTKLAIIAFKSINYYTKTVIQKEFPHTNKRLNHDQTFKTFRFIGVGHAIRASLFQEVGLYQEDYFYAGEEFDLSFRAIQVGYDILYYPKIYLYHKHAPSGRLTSKRTLEYTLLNKMKIAFTHLPRRFAIINVIFWITFITIKSYGKVNIIKIVFRFIKWSKKHRQLRKPLSNKAITYIHMCGGQLWK